MPQKYFDLTDVWFINGQTDFKETIYNLQLKLNYFLCNLFLQNENKPVL